MQNINIRIDNSTDWKQSQNRMNYATRMLGLFGGSSIPRSTVVIDTIFVIFSDYLLEASFVDALGKLTGFKTVAVTVKMLHFMRPDCNGPNYNILDEYLKVMLGGGEGGKFDKAGRYCLTYHPRGRAACRKTALV